MILGTIEFVVAGFGARRLPGLFRHRYGGLENETSGFSFIPTDIIGDFV